MASIALALALFLQGQPAAAAPPPPAVEEERLPAGAPKDDYQFVGWCYGMLRGYLDLHDQVMPEVTRIESAFRPPDRKLSDDLQVYADLQKEGQKQLKLFQSALTAAEKASLKPINTLGAKAVAQGADVWRAASDVTPARLAQEWMSWALPARCEVTARALKSKATLLGGAFKVNDTPEAPADAEKPVETKDTAAEEAKPAGDAPAASLAAPPAEALADAKPSDPAAVLLDANTSPPAKAPAKGKTAKGKASRKAKPAAEAAPQAPPEPAPVATSTPQ